MKTLGLLLVGTLLVGACGSDDSESDGAAGVTAPSSSDTGDTPATPDAGDASPSGLPPGGSGTVTIDGEVITAEWVGNCLIDEQFSPAPGDLDINVGLGNGLDALFLEVNNREVAGLPPDAEAYVYMQLRPELQLKNDGGSYESLEGGPFVTGPDGTWYLDESRIVPQSLAMGIEHDGIPQDPAPLAIDGDHVTGQLTLDGSTGAVEVSFDLMLIDAVDCSLG